MSGGGSRRRRNVVYNGRQQGTIVYCCSFSPSDWPLESLHQVTHCQVEAETYVKKVFVRFVLFGPLMLSNRQFIYVYLYSYCASSKDLDDVPL